MAERSSTVFARYGLFRGTDFLEAYNARGKPSDLKDEVLCDLIAQGYGESYFNNVVDPATPSLRSPEVRVRDYPISNR